MLIVYCETCGFRIQEDEISSGRAAQVAENRYNCAKCSAAAAPKRATTGSLTTQPRNTPDGSSRPPSGVTSVIRPKSTVMRSASAQSAESEAEPDRRVVRKPLPLIPIVGGATILLVVVAMFVALTSGEIAPVAKNDAPKTNDAAKVSDAPKSTPPPARVEERSAQLPAERPEDKMRRAMEETARLTGRTETVPANAQQSPPARSAVTAGGPQMLSQPDPTSEAAFNDRATRSLKEIQDWSGKNPGDPWTYKEKLETFSQTYRSALAGAEARRLASEIKLPAGGRPPDSMNWHKDWNVSPGATQTAFFEEWDGRRFVFQSHPISNGVPCITARSFLVPADRPFFEIRLRAHDAGDYRFVVAVSGFEMVNERVGGRDWRNFTLDLSGLKGQNVDIELIHHNTDWSSEFAYLQSPRFADKPATDAKVITWDSKNTAAALAKNTPGKIDLLALADPAVDSVAGTWNKTSEGLVSTSGVDHRIQFPYIPPAEYDFRITFTRKEGNDCIAMTGSHGDRDFVGILSGWGGKYSGFSRIDGKSAESNPSRVDFLNLFKPGEKHSAVMQVRNDRLRLLVDDQLHSEIKTDYSNTESEGQWRPRERLWLALGTYNSVFVFHSIEVVEIGALGRPQRGSIARKTTDAVASPAAVAASAGGTAAPTGNVEADYAAASDEAFGVLAKGNVRAAREQFEKLAADSRFTALKAKLNFDLAFVKLAETTPRAVTRGAQALNDGRPFVFIQANGKNLSVGRGTKNIVKEATDVLITIEQDLGGGKALTRVAVEQLTPQTRFELARIGQQADPDGDIHTALNALLLIRSGQGEFPARAIRSMLDAAKKKPENAKLAEHLTERFESAGKEVAAEQLYQKADQAYAARKMEDAKKLLETLEKDHASTAFWARNRNNAGKLLADVTKALFPLEKGLMFEYCRPEGGERFKEVKLRRPETKLSFEWGDAEPAPGVDRDFSIRIKGILRVEKGGRYGFSVRADDIGIATIDGKPVVTGNTGNNGDGEIDLTPGDHTIAAEHQDTGGPAVLQIRWRLVGSFDLQDIPESALWHDPKAK